MTRIEEIKVGVMRYPQKMNLYIPNLCTWHRTDPRTMQKVINEMLESGQLKKMKTLRYRGDVMSYYTVDFDKDFNWEDVQDPEDYMPLTKDDVEIVECYRVIK